MSNRDVNALWRYHEATKHSPLSLRANRHYLDWTNRPLPFKIYSDLQPIPLPRDWPTTKLDALSAISCVQVPSSAEVIPDLKTLASLIYHSAGITRRRSYPGGEIYFRAAACTGALYEIDLYVVCGRLPDLEAGVYHFDPVEFALRRLRSGDWRGVLGHATGLESSVVRAPATIVCTGTYWRNAWKYQARTYRHFFWDTGTLLANLLATAAAFGLPARLVMGFVDDEVNRLLGLDSRREVTLALVPLGGSSGPAPEISAHVDALEYRTVPLSREEVDYPLMREAHQASSLANAEEVKQWRGGAPPPRTVQSAGRTFDLKPLRDSEASRETIEQVILRRGSTRRFARAPIRFDQLSTILHRATQGIPADFLDSGDAGCWNDLYIIVNAVEGLPPGSYRLRPDALRVELLKEGEFREQAGFLGLEQELPADAAVAIFFLADLNAVFGRLGNRGYRAVQIEAGILGGKIYLTAYAQNLGATGLTFYDDEVTGFFSPHAAGKSAIFLTAVGIPAKRELPIL